MTDIKTNPAEFAIAQLKCRQEQLEKWHNFLVQGNLPCAASTFFHSF